MLGKLLRSSLAAPAKSAAHFRFKVPYKTTRRMDVMSDKDLFNPTYAKHVISSRFSGHTMKEMRNLYHGVKTRTGHKVCFSDKKHKRWFKPNTFKRVYHSNILNKTFGISVSTKAIKTIRKYGGFDNYILMVKPDKSQSLFGEYLRRLMYMKLNNPEIDVENSNIFGVKRGSTSYRPRTRMTAFLGFSRETRHKDLSAVNPNLFTEMTKREIATVKKLQENPDRVKEILSQDQSYLDSVAQAEEEMKKLIPLSKKIKAEFENMKDKKALRLYRLQIYDAMRNASTMSGGNVFNDDKIKDMDADEEVNKED